MTREITPESPALRRSAQTLLDRHADNTSEADIRGALRDFLVAAKLARRADIQMESKAGGGRIDLESDDLVIEVKRRIGTRLDATDDNKQQLDHYLRALARDGKPPRLGILTDGKYWLLRRPGAAAWSAAPPYAFTLEDANRGYNLYEWLRDESQALERSELTPTDGEVRKRLGPGPRFEQHLQSLRELYEQRRDEPTIAIKRRLWRQLLAAALGEVIEHEDNLDDLFLRHTYLSAVVALALQSAFGINIVQYAQRDPAELLNGQLFVNETGVRGVVESDFFTWPAEVEGGAWLRGLARRVDRFDWTRAESDVARILYETVIPADDRRRLGEYYTPDWLAREIVDAVVTDPLNQRVLDPACGSGSFIFAAVRKYLAAARAARRKPARVLDGLLTHVTGIDVHPAAVHLARATWTFAAREALERARGAEVDVTVPIYLGDSLQLRTESRDMFARQNIPIPVEEDPTDDLERNRTLYFPRALVEQADWFDGLMTRLASAIETGEDPSLALHDTHIPESGPERETLDRTIKTLIELRDEGRDHIWVYYTRNLVRPVALSKSKVDVVVGNPPWLTYNRTEAVVRSELERQSKAVYEIWTGGRYATHQDVAGLFFARCADLYLKPNGVAAMVLPHSALQAGQYREWRDGSWGPINVDFAIRRPWDLERIEPNTFFPVPACVAFLRRVDGDAKPLPAAADRWRGEQGGPFTRETVPLADTSGKFASPYGDRARQGAILVPRCLFFVNVEESRIAVKAQNVARTSPRRGSQDKQPWKDLNLDKLADQPIEREHIWNVHLGETVAPYVLLDPLQAVLPLSNKTGELVKKPDGLLGLDPNHLGTRMRRRWRTINSIWDEHKSRNTKLDLLGQIDYMSKLSAQRPTGRQADRPTGRQADRPTGRQADRPTAYIPDPGTVHNSRATDRSDRSGSTGSRRYKAVLDPVRNDRRGTLPHGDHQQPHPGGSGSRLDVERPVRQPRSSQASVEAFDSSVRPVGSTPPGDSGDQPGGRDRSGKSRDASTEGSSGRRQDDVGESDAQRNPELAGYVGGNAETGERDSPTSDIEAGSTYRVLYSSSGRPTAVRVADPVVLVESTLYWITARSAAEADYLTAVINSSALETALEPLMPKGQFGARHVQKHLWRLPIPEYDDDNQLHRDIAAAAVEATAGATALLQEVQTTRAAQGKPTTATIARREIRNWLAKSAEGQQVERLVAQLLK